MQTVAKNINALIVIVISGILLSAYGVQFILGEQPCPLCMLQRLGMIGVTVGCLLNVACGIKSSHYALMLLSSLVGGGIALRQIALHVCPQFSKFGEPILGLNLYTWSFIVFVCVVFVVSLLLFLYDPTDPIESKPKVNVLGKIAFVLIAVVTLANVMTTWLQCGLGPCSD